VAQGQSTGTVWRCVVCDGVPVVVMMGGMVERWEGMCRVVLTDDQKRAAFRALQERIVTGEGRASREQRARAFSHTGLPQPLDGLLGKVATSPTQVTDADFAAARAAGLGEDELFELVVCAAVGLSARLYDAGLAALAGAVAGEEDG